MFIEKKINWRKLNRTIHRDIGYFFSGLMLAFSISGIALNHRKSFDPMTYTVESSSFTFDTSTFESKPDYFTKLAKEHGLDSEFRALRERGGLTSAWFRDGVIRLDPKTGQGDIEFTSMRPVLGQMTLLHKTTDVRWIWFSDIFGVMMVIIVITGMFISVKNNSFKKRGWWVATLGLIIPIGYLFIH